MAGFEPFHAEAIRDFRIRGCFVNRRKLLAPLGQRTQRSGAPPPGYAAAVVELERDHTPETVDVRDIDLPLLCQADVECAKQHLSLILRARRGDPAADRSLLSAVEAYQWQITSGLQGLEPAESRFVVPSSSREQHSEAAVSHKGSTLLTLSQLGYPVPDFAILTAEAFTDRDSHLETHVANAVRQLEILTLRHLGGEAPLVIALRCAMPNYLPGVMRTYLNVGVTERVMPGLRATYGRLAADRMFLNTLRNICVSIAPEHHTDIVEAVAPGLSPDEIAGLIDRLSETVARRDRRLLEDPFHQVAFFVRQAYAHFEDNQELLSTLSRGAEHYPCLILQEMICTVRQEDAYVGVVHSRHSQMGVGTELQTARNIFGEEIMTGTTAAESTVFDDPGAIRDTFPAVYHFFPHLAELERTFEAPVTIEFAVDATRRYQWFALLQLNEAGLAGRAAFIAVVDMHRAGTISRTRVTELIRPYHVRQITSDSLDENAYDGLAPFCFGVAILPRSAISARIYFTDETALRAKQRGEVVCFCKDTFVPTDTVVMREMDAILSLTSAAIHVITICQSLGMPALLNLEQHGVSRRRDGKLVNPGGIEIAEGDWITISSRRKSLYAGKAKFKGARLLRYMRGEDVKLAAHEVEAFAAMAYAYRYYQQLIRGVSQAHGSTLHEIVRLVNLELRGEADEARQLVNGWFDDHEELYVDGVLQSDIGDHLSQSTVFDMLALDRKIRFFKRSVERCVRERISGYEAGAFMLGRFLATRYPVAFWRRFGPTEVAVLVNEWVLFEKYMQVLRTVGEKKIVQTRKQILRGGLDEILLHPGNVRAMIPLKVGGTPLAAVRASLPEWSDPQTARLLDLLQEPYRVFYDFDAPWSVKELETICLEAQLPVPGPADT